MITIHRVGLDEIETLQQIAKTTFQETFADSNSESDMVKYLAGNFSLDKISAELSNPNSQFFIARDDSTAVGYLKVNAGDAQTELKEEYSLEIERIYVLNAYHGKQVGQLLYQQALDVAVSLGKSSVWLGVWEKNPRAIRFYEKNGFIAFDTHIFRMGEDDQTDLMMRKDLMVV